MKYFPTGNFACEGAVDIHKILVVRFQMEVYMFQYIFQDLKAVEDAIAFLLPNAPLELGSDECLTYAHYYL